MCDSNRKLAKILSSRLEDIIIKLWIRLVLILSLVSQSMGMGLSGLNLDVKDKLMMETLFYEGGINKNVKEVLGHVYTEQLKRKRVVLVAMAFQEILRVIRESMRLQEESLKEERLIKLYKNFLYSFNADTEFSDLIRYMVNSLIKGFKDIIIKYIEEDIAHNEDGSYDKEVSNRGWEKGKSKGIIYGEDITEIYGDWDIGIKTLREKLRRNDNLEVRKITGERSLKPLSVIKLEGNRIIISKRMLELLRKMSLYMKKQDYEELIDVIYTKYIKWDRLPYREQRFKNPEKAKLLQRFNKYRKEWDIKQYNKITEFEVNKVLGYVRPWRYHPLLKLEKFCLIGRLFRLHEAGLLKQGSICIEFSGDLLDLISKKLPKTRDRRYTTNQGDIKEETWDETLSKDSEEITKVLKILGSDILRIYNRRNFDIFNRLVTELTFLGVYGKTKHACKACSQLSYIVRQIRKQNKMSEALKVTNNLKYIILNSDDEEVIIEGANMFEQILAYFYGLPTRYITDRELKSLLHFMIRIAKDKNYSDYVRVGIIKKFSAFISHINSSRSLSTLRQETLAEIGKNSLIIAQDFLNYQNVVPCRNYKKNKVEDSYLGNSAFRMVEFSSNVLFFRNLVNINESLITKIIKIVRTREHKPKVRFSGTIKLISFLKSFERISKYNRFQLDAMDRLYQELKQVSISPENYDKIFLWELNYSRQYVGNKASAVMVYIMQNLLASNSYNKGLGRLNEIIEIIGSKNFDPKVRLSLILHLKGFINNKQGQRPDLKTGEEKALIVIGYSLESGWKNAGNYKDIIVWDVGDTKDTEHKKYYLGGAAMDFKGFAAEALLSKGNKTQGLKLINNLIKIVEDEADDYKVRLSAILNLKNFINKKKEQRTHLNQGEEAALIVIGESLESVWKNADNYKDIILCEVGDRNDTEHKKHCLGDASMGLKIFAAEALLKKGKKTQGLKLINNLIKIAEDEANDSKVRLSAILNLISFINKKKEQRTHLNQGEEEALIVIGKSLELVWKNPDNYKDIIPWEAKDREDKQYYLGGAAMDLKGFAAEALLSKGNKTQGLKLINNLIKIVEDEANDSKMRLSAILNLTSFINKKKEQRPHLNQGEEEALIAIGKSLESVCKNADNYKDIIQWEAGDTKDREYKKYYLGYSTMGLKTFVAEALLRKGRKTEGLRLINDLIKITEDEANDSRVRLSTILQLTGFVNKKKKQKSDLNQGEEEALIAIGKSLESVCKNADNYKDIIQWETGDRRDTEHKKYYLGEAAMDMRVFAVYTLSFKDNKKYASLKDRMVEKLCKIYKDPSIDNKIAKSAINKIGGYLILEENKDLDFIIKSAKGKISNLPLKRQRYAIGQIQGIIIRMLKAGRQKEAEKLMKILLDLFNDKKNNELIREKAAAEIAGVILGGYMEHNIYNDSFMKYLKILCAAALKEEIILVHQKILVRLQNIKDKLRILEGFSNKEEIEIRVNAALEGKNICISKNGMIYEEKRDKNSNQIIYAKMLKGPTVQRDNPEGIYEIYNKYINTEHWKNYNRELDKFSKLSFDSNLFLMNIIDILLKGKSNSGSLQNLSLIKELLKAA